MKKCCICGCEYTRKTVSYPELPAMQSLVCQDIESARRAPRGRIDIYVCPVCGAVFNGSFSPDLICYSHQYDNSQDFSPVFAEHVEDMISYALDHQKEPSAVLEIGCGKGHFLRRMAERTMACCQGYDTSYMGPEEGVDGRLRYYSKYYEGVDGGREGDQQTYDIVISRHVIEHIQNPVEMLKLIAGALADTGILYLETPSLEWILEHKIMFDFTYEHCSYFTMETMKNLLHLGGLEIVDGKYTFSGQYLSVIARRLPVGRDPAQPCDSGLETGYMDRLTQQMNAFEVLKNRMTGNIRGLLQGLRTKGETAFWGAAGKGVLCCNLFDPARELTACVADINPNKQGAYIPCTGHPIVAPAQLSGLGVSRVLATNGNYLQEIQCMVAGLDPSIEVLDFEKILENTAREVFRI